MEQFRDAGPDPLTVRPMRPEDESDVARVLGDCDDYLVAATGSPALPADVQSLYYALPDGADFEQKHLLVVCDRATVVGVVDAVAGHPDSGTCAVGMFLLTPGTRRKGVGTRAAQRLLQEAAARGMRRVTATCPQGWAPGLAFLRSLGFELHAPPPQPQPTVGDRLRHPAETNLCTAFREVPGGSSGGTAAESDRERHNAS
ncbi:GNAT family N-acetyltransferase [Streptomyces sp. V4I2]|uniref:GNAT family N-acetyltransferase n=1 Tax=Streptomyces sp. V4I2 TaxID=3042280 RepID=UPI0027832EA7|nr:GNAT family N-acetyltransferase [Streptomyces sp. V4I2]MDQ1049649.1 GNAT superfamily N-acetyltransferase [Streptomyces sp. V4I2]